MDLVQSGPVRSKIDRELVGDPIRVGERTIRPVARLLGWSGSMGGPQGGGGGAWVRLSPVKVIVQEKDGREQEVPIADPTREALRGIAMGALVIGILGWLLLLIVKLKRRSAK